MFGLLSACGGGSDGDPSDTAVTTASDTVEDTSGPSDTGDTGVTTTTGPSDTSVETDSGPATCDERGFHPTFERFVTEGDELTWFSNDSITGNAMFIRFDDAEGFPLPSGPGTYELGTTETERSPEDCARCVVILTDCVGPECDGGGFLATSGAIEISALDPDPTTGFIAGRLVGARLYELDDDFETVLADGDVWCVDTLSFDSRPECASDAECSGEVCHDAWGKCTACETSFDCTEATAPACTVDATDGALGCGVVADCAGNDVGEPDDGPLQARPLVLGSDAVPATPLEGAMCRARDAVDWYTFELDGRANLMLELGWQGSVGLTARLYAADGAPVPGELSVDREAGQNRYRLVYGDLTSGRYHVVVEAVDGPAALVLYRVSATAREACDDHPDCSDGWCVVGECVPRRDCDVQGVPVATQQFTPAAAETFTHRWRGETYFSGGDNNTLMLTLVANEAAPDPFPNGPGSYPLGGAADLDPETCTRCLELRWCDLSFVCRDLVAVAGGVEVTSWDLATGELEAELVDLVFIELGPDFVHGRIGGKVICDDAIAVSTQPGCLTSEECGDGAQCRPGDVVEATCVACLGASDCVDPARPTCSPRTRTCVACETSADCRDAPACVDGLCAAVDACVGDDDAEHADDAIAGATSVTAGTDYTRAICGEELQPSVLEVDWFSFVSAGAALTDLGVRRTEPGTIIVTLLDPLGVPVAQEISASGSAIIRHQLSPGRWSVSVRARDIPADAPLPYTFRVDVP